MSEREQRELRDGAGDAFANAFELIATPAIFGLIGWLIDSQVGTFPIFTLALVFVVLAYEVWKFTTAYNAKMDEALQERRASYGQEHSDA